MLKKHTAFLLFLLFAPVSSAFAADSDDAKQFVDTVGKRVLGIVNAHGDKDQQQKQLQQMFVENVDIPWMGKFVLGYGWQQASAEQRTQYLQSYQRYLLAHYTSNFADYTGANYTITGAKNEGDSQYSVSMEIKTPNQSQDTLAGYRLRKEGNGQFKIVDIIIEGVSLITTQRSEFGSVIQQKGIDGLIQAIEAKTKMEKQS